MITMGPNAMVILLIRNPAFDRARLIASPTIGTGKQNFR
jgi:hypothetical protein